MHESGSPRNTSTSNTFTDSVRRAKGTEVENVSESTESNRNAVVLYGSCKKTTIGGFRKFMELLFVLMGVKI